VVLLNYIYRDVQNHGAALDPRAPQRPRGVRGGRLRSADALGDSSGMPRQSGLVDLEVRPQRRSRYIRGQD